ncbi:MAG: RluA family pseudouridine synthase [Acidobacteria bacterium]|nr:RluA family pseudouridine synthase [Acidobacteriota bacterium]
MPAAHDAPGGPAELIRVDVGAADGAVRLDRLLAARLAGRTRSQLQRLIRDGHARIGSKTGRPGSVVQAGDVVTLAIPPPRPAVPEPEPIPLTIVYEDSDLVVVDKPAGMVVHPAAGHARHTLVNALLHHVTDLSGIGGALRPGIVHRLDRGTSGLIVVAKHDRSHGELARQFRCREVEKTYVTLVWGAMEAGRQIDLAIGRDPVDRKKISTRSRRPRAAVTRVVSAEQLDGATLLEVRIVTGRTHQIRVHLRAVGHPVVGDPDYGGVRRRLPPRLRALQRLERPFLHASRLVFSHPRDGRRLDIHSNLPADLVEAVEALRGARGEPLRRTEIGQAPG